MSVSSARAMEVELTEPLPTVPASGPYRRVLVLARLFAEPVGLPPDPWSRPLARRCESRRKDRPTPVQGGQRAMLTLSATDVAKGPRDND